MFTKQNLNNLLLSLFILLCAVSLSSCAQQAFSETPDEEETTPDIIFIDDSESESVVEGKSEEPKFLTHSDARDIAVSYLLEKYDIESPDKWTVMDQTPENLLGTSAYGYTSGAWVVFVESPVVAPEYLVYNIQIDQISNGLRWMGEVDAQGKLKEISVSGPMQVLSVENARDAAAAYIVENHEWEVVDQWIEQSLKPIENAGVRYTFTAGPWVIQVEFLAAAPIVPEYRVVADNLSLVERWEGTIKADGQLIEEAFISN